VLLRPDRFTEAACGVLELPHSAHVDQIDLSAMRDASSARMRIKSRLTTAVGFFVFIFLLAAIFEALTPRNKVWNYGRRFVTASLKHLGFA
jgi:hypothetical protein